jgi:hypothetical protein
MSGTGDEGKPLVEIAFESKPSSHVPLMSAVMRPDASSLSQYVEYQRIPMGLILRLADWIHSGRAGSNPASIRLANKPAREVAALVILWSAYRVSPSTPDECTISARDSPAMT